jgi:hypothetical protein
VVSKRSTRGTLIGEIMWKVYKWNGHYIMGDLISKHSTESAALKAAKKNIKFIKSEREETKTEVNIWLDGENSSPLGVIVKKKRG